MEPRARDPLVLLLVMASFLAIAIVCLGTAPAADAATIVVPDDYGTIQEAIDNATSGDTIRVHAGTYIEAVTVGLDVDIVGNGTTETIIQSAAAATVTIIFDGVSISDVQVKGGTTAGIYLAAASCVVERVDCTGNVRGLGLYGADDNHIGNSTFTGNSYAGIGVYSGSDRNDFVNVSCDGNGNFGLDVFSGSSYNTFETCSFDQCTGTGVLINGGADHNTIANSTMDDNGNYGIAITQSSYTKVYSCSASGNLNNHGAVIYDSISHNLISHLVVDNNGMDGIFVEGDSDSRYDNVTATGNGDRGIGLNTSIRIVIQHCVLEGNVNYGTYHLQNTYIDILDCTVFDNTYGIDIQDCQGYSIGRNRVNNNDGHGIAMQNSGGTPSNRVFENEVSGNAKILSGFEAGLFLIGFANTNGNVIEDNLFIGNNKAIVFLFNAANNNIVRGNYIKDSVAVGIEYSFNPGPNTFYHNNFVNNAVDVQAPHAADVYDNGYPSGGNFWDSYAGSDDYSGPAQNIWGPDSIGDVPHAVGGAVQDDFPLFSEYSDILDSIAIVQPHNGALVSGLVLVEAVVVSSSVSEVRFYLDGTLVGRDGSAPFQLLLDTTKLVEDKVYSIDAIADRRFGIPITSGISVRVNNQAQVGNYLDVTTISISYHPDDRITTLVRLAQPPEFDEIELHVQYRDAAGNPVQVLDARLEPSGMYGFTFSLPSDITTGNVEIEVSAKAYLKASLVWKATDLSSITISGSTYHEEMAAIQALLDSVLSEIDGLNVTTQAQLAMALSQIMASMDAMGASVGTMLSDMWSDYNTTEDANLASIVATISDMWTGINGSAQQGFAAVLASLGMTEDNVTTGLATLQAALAGNIQLSRQQIQAELDDLWGGLNTSFSDLDGAIQARLDQLEVTMADDGEALREYIDLKTLQIELYMDMINASIQLRLDAVDAAIAAFQEDTAEELLTIQASLEGLEQNGSAHFEALLEAMAETNRLVEALNSTTLADLRAGLVELQRELEGLNNTEGTRHAQTVEAMLLGLDALSGQVSDGLNETGTQLLALDKLDTILLELDSVSADVADTKEAASGGDDGVMVLLFLLVVLAIANLGFMFIGLQKLRSARSPPPEPPMEALEPVALVDLPVTVEEEEAPTPDYGLAMEEPIMYPPGEPEMLSGPPESPPEPPAPEPPAPAPAGKYERHEAIWAEEILVEEGVSTVDDGPGTEASEAEMAEEPTPSQEPSGEYDETPEGPVDHDETRDAEEAPADDEQVGEAQEDEPGEGGEPDSDWELEDITDEI